MWSAVKVIVHSYTQALCMPDMHKLCGFFFRVSKPNAPIVKLSVINQNLDTLVSRVGLTYFVLGFQKIEASKKEIFSDTIMEFGIEINTENILLRSCKITNCN
jgi:hypothetical protein